MPLHKRLQTDVCVVVVCGVVVVVECLCLCVCVPCIFCGLHIVANRPEALPDQ